MSKQGVYKISGNTKPKVGETVTYTIDEWYPATPREKRNPALVTWHLFKKVNGNFVPTTIKKKGISSFTFQNIAYKNTYRIEAYLYEPEGKAPMALEVQPQQGDVPRINGIQLKYADNTPGNVFSFTEKLIAESQCTGLEGKYLTFTLWEDDIQGNGHDARNMQIDRKKGKVISGVAKAEFTLTSALMKKAMQGETDVKQLEFYVTVEYYENKKHASRNVHINTPQEIYIPSNKPKPKPAPHNSQPKVEGSPAEQKGPSQKEQKGIIETTTETISGVVSKIEKKIYDWGEAKGTVKKDQKPAPPPPSGKSPTVVKEEKIENLLDAYFAKKEYTRQTNEEDGTHTYTFGGTKQNNKTSTNTEKNKVAQTILNKIKDNLKSQKKYTTLEVISAALTAEAYGKDTVNEKTVEFKIFKLGAEFKKVESTPLEDKLYLVAKTMLLEGKEVKIIIKEKDGLIKGSADAVLPVLEITEEQMEQKATSGEVAGTEKTEFSGVVKDNLVKIPIHLRPKSDEELKQWKEKISKGKEDGDYTYKFGGPTSIKNEAEKKSIAGIILNNAKDGKRGNPKIEESKTSSTEEIEKVLEIKAYKEGDTITFKLLKKVPELLYLNAKAQGEKQHDKEFLKKEGAYFQIGNGGCSCNRDLTELEFKEILKFLRESEKLEINDIWNPRNTGGSKPEDSSLSSTVRNFNEVMKKYDINTCIRKVYFLAECYHETDRFYSTQEYGAGTLRYDPYRGRGIIQLTHKEAYERYSYYRNNNSILSNCTQVATNLDFTFDSAGWYWKQGKLLSVGNSWAPSSGARERFNLNSRSYPKTNYDTKYTNDDGLTVKKYGSINLNLVADNDDINVISYLINGGDNGLAERKKYLNELKKLEIFKCNKNQNHLSGDWHHPLDRMELRGWYKSGFYPGSSDHGDAPIRNSGHHDGLDLYAPIGTQIYACIEGSVHEIYVSTTYGNTINIKGTYKGQTYYFFYAHLSEVNVSEGDPVQPGKPIGKTGQTGNATGQASKMNHLHFEVRTTGERSGGRVDPFTTIQELGTDVNRNPDKNTQTGN
jgi:predicted chitinase